MDFILLSKEKYLQKHCNSMKKRIVRLDEHTILNTKKAVTYCQQPFCILFINSCYPSLFICAHKLDFKFAALFL